jgi:Domain of unknown function (DUF4062)
MARVYVSSTISDLKRERRTVLEWLVAARHQPVHSYRPSSETVRDSVLASIHRVNRWLFGRVDAKGVL